MLKCGIYKKYNNPNSFNVFGSGVLHENAWITLLKESLQIEFCSGAADSVMILNEV